MPLMSTSSLSRSVFIYKIAFSSSPPVAHLIEYAKKEESEQLCPYTIQEIDDIKG